MDAGKLKILAIDDNRDNLVTFQALIGEAFPEASFYPATDGPAGLELAAEKDPDVVLLDIVMPGMDGFEVCSRIKSDPLLRDIPVVFLTALKADRASRIKALEAGAEAFLSKPIDAVEFHAQIRAMAKIKAANAGKLEEKQRLEQLVTENESALRHWNELMRYIIEHDRSAVAVHDKAYRYIFVSKRYLEDYKVREEDVIGQHHYDVFPDLPEKWREAHRKALAGEVTSAEDDPYIKDDGTVEWTRWECRPWYEANGEIGGFIVYTEVITERKNMELELVAAKEKAQESDRLKTAFLANMSHEIRTPMNGILGFAQILKDPRISEAQQKHFLDVIEKSGQRLLNLINDIIDVSKIESGHREMIVSEVSVYDTLKYMFELFKPNFEQEKSGVELSLDLPEEDIRIVTDRDKLHSVLINLIRNAEKFTHEGRVIFGCYLEEDSLVWYVKDTGIGIPADKQPKVFDRFFQADLSFSRGYEGAGLGLSICDAFVRMMGGHIWLKSEPGKGSVFWFSLPLEPGTEDSETIIEEDAIPPRKKRKEQVNVLVVEDDPASYDVIKFMLEEEGFRLYHAGTGEEAIDLFSEQGHFDLILMDIKMPGIDGYKTTREIRKINREVPIIAQTAHALSGDEEKSLAAGCNDYLTKPLKKELLLNKIRQYLH